MEQNFEGELWKNIRKQKAGNSGVINDEKNCILTFR